MEEIVVLVSECEMGGGAWWEGLMVTFLITSRSIPPLPHPGFLQGIFMGGRAHLCIYDRTGLITLK